MAQTPARSDTCGEASPGITSACFLRDEHRLQLTTVWLLHVSIRTSSSACAYSPVSNLHRPRSARAGEIDVVRQSVPSRCVGVGPILQRTQEPPPVRPFWVELHRVAVELDCAGKVALFPGGCGTLS
jgi:hypothetical protein